VQEVRFAMLERTNALGEVPDPISIDFI